MAEKKIKGTTYKVEPMLAMDAIKLKAKLLKVIGGGVDRLPEILSGIGSKSKEEKEAANGAAIAAFTDIFVNGDPDEMANLVKEVLEVAMVHRPSGAWEQADVDTFTTENMAEMFEVVVFVLQETFGAFFSDLLSSGKLKKKAAA